jgi:DNA-binding NarL/FixJ family response regulator
MLFDENNPIKVIIADDHEVVRAGVKRLISIDKKIRIVDEAPNGKLAVESVKYHQPHVALLDILMPEMTGIEAAKIIKIIAPETYVVILTAYEDSKHLEEALAAGADGYLTKDISSRDLIKAILSVVQGERVFSKSILMVLQNKFVTKSDAEESPVSITKREQEILNFVADGKTSAEISELLDISIRTVESHRYNLMQKLGVKNTASLVRYTVNHNIN